MAGELAEVTKVTGDGAQPAAEMMLPNPVHKYPRGQRIRRLCQPVCKCGTTPGRIPRAGRRLNSRCRLGQDAWESRFYWGSRFVFGDGGRGSGRADVTDEHPFRQGFGLEPIKFPQLFLKRVETLLFITSELAIQFLLFVKH